MYRSFVPWVWDAASLAGVLQTVPEPVRRRIEPRLHAPDGAPAAALARLCAGVFVDEPAGDVPAGAVTIDALDGGTAGMGGRAVQISLSRFFDRDTLAAAVQGLGGAGSRTEQMSVFVDIPAANRPETVIVAAAVGAVRRLEALGPWARIVVALDGELAGTEQAPWTTRPPLEELARRPELGNVSLAERPPSARTAYPTSSRWYRMPTSSADGPIVAELVTSQPEFDAGCCDGDGWLAAAAAMQAHAGDLERWQWASVVHWVTAASRLVSTEDPPRPTKSNRVGSSP